MVVKVTDDEKNSDSNTSWTQKALKVEKRENNNWMKKSLSREKIEDFREERKE
ncbi:hypothetical protein LCGC14_2337360 [marine sediment metagenome]|uniref:Uncharacterized protein n=1 Tax=marine sediment metagenome TaxID=412755 RepID=A0A0F9CD29_9ZZZZ